jgi:predicted nucleotidyltransferase
MTPVTEELLQNMVKAIVEEVRPEKIILFGSWAKGQARPDSDVDFLVIESGPFSPERSRRKEMVRIWDALRHFVVPVDILLYNHEEVENWRNSLNHVVGIATREGKVVYERP